MQEAKPLALCIAYTVFLLSKKYFAAKAVYSFCGDFVSGKRVFYSGDCKRPF